MNEISETDMQKDLERWQDEHASWLRDVKYWQEQHESAMSDLEHLEASCVDHGHAVGEHAEAIVAHEQVLLEQARRLAERHGTVDRDDEMMTLHQQLAAQRAQQCQAHERIKKHHDAVIAQLRGLVRAVREAM